MCDITYNYFITLACCWISAFAARCHQTVKQSRCSCAAVACSAPICESQPPVTQQNAYACDKPWRSAAQTPPKECQQCTQERDQWRATSSSTDTTSSTLLPCTVRSRPSDSMLNN